MIPIANAISTFTPRQVSTIPQIIDIAAFSNVYGNCE